MASQHVTRELHNRRFSVSPLEAGLSAEVTNFPFESYCLDDVDVIKAAWNEFPVLRFRGSTLSDEDQIRFSKEFGPPVVHPAQNAEGAHASHPEILVISNVKADDGKPQGALGDGEVEWHSDTPFVERTPAGAFLRGIVIPATGGNTEFLSMYAAYDTLSAELRKAVEGRCLHHQSIYKANMVLRSGVTDPGTDDILKWPGVDHPIVRTHGDTKRKCLYLGFRNYARVVGVPLDESEAIVEALWHHATNDNPVWSQLWKPGDLLMWDNRCVMHRRDPFDPLATRLMHRTTSQGERPA